MYYQQCTFSRTPRNAARTIQSDPLTSLVLVANNSFRAYSLPATFYVSLSFISKGFPIELFPITLNEMSDKDLPRTESASLGELPLL